MRLVKRAMEKLGSISNPSSKINYKATINSVKRDQFLVKHS